MYPKFLDANVYFTSSEKNIRGDTYISPDWKKVNVSLTKGTILLSYSLKVVDGLVDGACELDEYLKF